LWICSVVALRCPVYCGVMCCQTGFRGVSRLKSAVIKVLSSQVLRTHEQQWRGKRLRNKWRKNGLIHRVKLPAVSQIPSWQPLNKQEKMISRGFAPVGSRD
jgi:hypothetical protein